MGEWRLGQTANGCASKIYHLECVFFGKIAKNKDFFENRQEYIHDFIIKIL